MTVMTGELPTQYVSVRDRFKDYFTALENFGMAARAAGPIDTKTAHLIQLAAATTIRSEGAVHSHARRALEVGATHAELYHAVLLTSSTIGFPNVSAAISWLDDLLSS